MSLFSEDPQLLRLARRVCEATGAPVVGGIAVFLHGYRRTTEDIDLFVEDAEAASEALKRIGARWDREAKEFLLQGVPIHLVTREQTGAPPRETTEIESVPVVSLADLVRFKLQSGLGRPDRAQDIADVLALIRSVPLDKRFAVNLPADLRAGFKRLVDAVRKAR